MTYPGVTSVEAVEDHRLLLKFDNGEARLFDAKPLLNVGRFRELTSEHEFHRVKVVFDTIEWDNGLDLDPEFLYQHSVAIAQAEGAAKRA